MRRAAALASLAALGAALGLAIAEAGLRLAASAYYSYRVGREAGPPGRRRVLCVGDSHTFGFGAPRGQGYPEQLQGLLDRAAPGGFRVVNAGVPGINSTQLADRLEALLREHRPDTLLVLIGSNNLVLYESSYHLFAPLSRLGWRGALIRADLAMRGLRVYRAARRSLWEIRARLRLSRYRERPDSTAEFERGRRLFEEAALSPRGSARGERLLAAAEARLRRSAALDPGNPWPHVFLGEILKAGDPGAARREFRLALELDPGGQLGLGSLWEAEAFEPEPEAMRKAFRYDMERIAASARRHGARLILQNYCWPLRMFDGDPIAEFAGPRGLPVVDHYSAFRGSSGRLKEGYHARDAHPNGRGYRLMAEGVFRTLRRLGIVDAAIAG